MEPNDTEPRFVARMFAFISRNTALWHIVMEVQSVTECTRCQCATSTWYDCAIEETTLTNPHRQIPVHY